MCWGEARDLILQLSGDPSSRFSAAQQGWEFPFSVEAILLADLYDLTNLIAADPKKRSRVKRHPLRPWPDLKVQRFGDAGGRSQDEVRAILSAARLGQLVANPAPTTDQH